MTAVIRIMLVFHALVPCVSAINAVVPPVVIAIARLSNDAPRCKRNQSHQKCAVQDTLGSSHRYSGVTCEAPYREVREKQIPALRWCM